jgi:hypothetical protein
MTMRASDRYYVLERLRSMYDKTDTYIAEDTVSGQVLRLRYDPFDGTIGSITIEDITMQVNGGGNGRGPSERYEIDQESFVTMNSQGIPGVEYPISHLDSDPAGFLYIRIYYDDRMKYRPNDASRWYYGTVEFIEEIFPSGDDETIEEADEIYK